MRRPVFGEPLRAHPPEVGSLRAPGHARLVDDQRATDGDENHDGEQHGGGRDGQGRRDCPDGPRSRRSRLCASAQARKSEGVRRYRPHVFPRPSRGMI